MVKSRLWRRICNTKIHVSCITNVLLKRKLWKSLTPLFIDSSGKDVTAIIRVVVWECLILKLLLILNALSVFKKYIEDYDSLWKHFLSFFLKDYGGKCFLYCNFNSSDLSDNLPGFYRECLNFWSKLTAKPAESREEVLKQILWNNQFVCINDKPVFNRRLFSKGIVKTMAS